MFAIQVKGQHNLFVDKLTNDSYDIGRTPKTWKTFNGVQKALFKMMEVAPVEAVLACTIVEIE